MQRMSPLVVEDLTRAPQQLALGARCSIRENFEKLGETLEGTFRLMKNALVGVSFILTVR
jgi:hypothetical protein